MTETRGRRWRLVRASKEAVPASVRRFFMAPRRRHLIWSRRGWGLAGVTAGLVLLVGWLVWGTSLLGVREVAVTGARITSEAEIRATAAVPARMPLARVQPAEVAARVAALPPVAQVTVRRDWPDTLVIEIVERSAVAVVPAPDGQSFQLVDAEGVVFQTVRQAPADLPVVVVADPGPDDPGTRAALTVLSALTPQLRAELASLTVAGPVDIQLALASGWTVMWGDESDSDAKARVATALLDQSGEIIDVSAPEVVSVR